jgi:molybdenum cofactor biosynthesis protein B
MSVADHKAASPAQVPCFVLSMSDTRTAGEDTSAQAIVDLLEGAGHTVTGRRLVKDEPAEVAGIVRLEIARGDARVILTTGGTGITKRDSTYEALAGMFEKTLSGFGELFRMLSYQEIGSAAMMSRATAGIVNRRAIFVLPGSEHAVRLAMTRLILPELGHIAQQLTK